MIYIENNLEKQDVFIPRNDGSTCYVSPYDNGYQDGYQDGIEDCGDCPIQQKDVVLTATTETISPDQGYAGMDSVFVDARQLALEEYNEGYHEGEEDGAEEQKSKLETATFGRNGEYTREDGWSAVTVDVPKDINLGTLVDAPPRISDLTYDTYINTFDPQEASVDGWGKVQIDLGFIIGDAKNQQKALMTGTTFTQNGLYRREDGWNEVIVEVPQTGTSCNLESKTETVTADTQTILPSSGYDGMSEVVVDATDYGQDKYDEGFSDGQASVPPCPPCPEIESAVTYGIGSGFTGATITPSSGYDGMAEVTITDNGYGQEKYDEGHGDGYNEGYQDGLNDCPACPQPSLEQKSVTLTATTECFTPSSGYDGFSEVCVDASDLCQDFYYDGFDDAYSGITFITPASSVTLTQYGVYAFVYDSGVTIPSMLVNFNNQSGGTNEGGFIKFQRGSQIHYENFALYNTGASTSSLDRIEIDDVVYSGGTTFTGDATKFVYYFNGPIPDSFFENWTSPYSSVPIELHLDSLRIGTNAFKNCVFVPELFDAFPALNIYANYDCVVKTGAFENTNLKSIHFLGVTALARFVFEQNSIINTPLKKISFSNLISSINADATLFSGVANNGTLVNRTDTLQDAYFLNSSWYQANLYNNGWTISNTY